ncbi:HlyD family efflux transporter periplasmic adaptor subunit [Caulobacter sp. SLTY]|uniref:HlyD family secretion protein n=1 Tax=Caulobacter sp. SLTY TaxID=2683262 RepID=UPI0014137110|nr:HlyD family secretion protein [Caulobacter sp. SLTY]NBB13993.1 HlyD family efflux transporter periplasmic adaptor subunit [Caulobacter sp. SLTY]
MPSISRQKLVPMAVAGVVGVAILVGGVFWWHGKQSFEGTDNAFVQADTVQISPQVSGYVLEVLVADNQRVEAGQVIARIDPATIQARLDQAIANQQALEADVQAVDDRAILEQAMIAQKAAGVQSARADAGRQAVDSKRYGELAEKGWVSEQKLQQVKAGETQSKASVEAAEAALVAEQRAAQSLGSARAQKVAQVQAARAQVQQARLDLERTVIRAPVAGVVGARSVRVGQLVQPGQTMMVVVPLGETYVLANFKETQLARLRIGQPVEIKADAFGKQAIKGHIDSFAPATGAEFALIPVENAVGNFTKIAQRVPVRIVVDKDQPMAGALRPGLSLEVKVDVRVRSGQSFAESGAATPQLAAKPETSAPQ